jgi:hypothetical protein
MLIVRASFLANDVTLGINIEKLLRFVNCRLWKNLNNFFLYFGWLSECDEANLIASHKTLSKIPAVMMKYFSLLAKHS